MLSWFERRDFQREVGCFAAEGMGVVSLCTQNRAGHCEFDFGSIWAAMKAAPKMPKMAHLYHTHPPGCDSMSGVDENAIKGWTTALGMPIEMVIFSGAGTRRYRCLPGNIIDDFGIRHAVHWTPGPDLHTESMLSAVLWGLSGAPRPCVAEEFEAMAAELNGAILVENWDLFEHNGPTQDEIMEAASIYERSMWPGNEEIGLNL